MTVDPGYLGTVWLLYVLGDLDGDLLALPVIDLITVLLVGVWVLLTFLLLVVMSFLIILGLISLSGTLGADLIILSDTLLILNIPGYWVTVGFIGGITLLYRWRLRKTSHR